MKTQPYRLESGGRIDRDHVIHFSFDGKQYSGYAGDTLASALLANGVVLVGRSFKYHRPRGVYTAGSEEPNALVTIGHGNRAEPNTRATMVELHEGLVASSQNAWPSLRFDIGAINNLLSRFFSAGFYYKTFMWPGARGWRFYEHFIRRAAGMGEAPRGADPDRYDHREAFCDLLVVGSGPAGLAAALTAARSGARVLLAEEHAELGGSVANSQLQEPLIADWARDTLRELASMPEVTLVTRCNAFGYYDGNVVGMVERVADHLAVIPAGIPRQRHWIVRAKQVILATGAIERPLLFANNDLPGIMLVSAARSYLQQFAVCSGRQIIIYTNNDSAYAAAIELSRHASVVVVDTRQTIKPQLLTDCEAAAVTVRQASQLTRAIGSRRVTGAELNGQDVLQCDLLLSSAGWTPTIHLHSQAGGRPRFDDDAQCFLPGEAREQWLAAGACNGTFATKAGMAEGQAAAVSALKHLDIAAAVVELPELSELVDSRIGPAPEPVGKCFVDLQNDVTIADLELGASEGYRSAELLKRYTSLGMGTDQGKTSNVNALALLAAKRGEPIPAIGVTTFRAPYVPVTMGAIAGRKQGAHILPTRFTPLHDWHLQRHALMCDSGLWKRPLGYPRHGESRSAAASREAAHVRNAVGSCDVSTLGKIDIQGPDAAQFLERVYVNRWSTLQPGKARYGLMLQDDGFVFDDGTTSCLGKNHYFMTTTTANAEPVLKHFEYLLQVVWPELRVNVTDVTDQWAAIAIAGPRSREFLESILGSAVSNDSLPFMGIADINYRDRLLRVVRISFSGELGYEIYTPANFGIELIEDLYEQGADFELQPYGLDAMEILRIEKGHVTGAEIDGQRTLDDLGMAAMARKDAFFIGGAMMQRPGLVDSKRIKLVGFLPTDPKQAIAAGAHLVADAKPKEPSVSLGHVSSACYSPTLGRHIGIGFVLDGAAVHDSILYVTNPLQGSHVQVQVVSAHFFDPQGERLRA